MSGTAWHICEGDAQCTLQVEPLKDLGQGGAGCQPGGRTVYLAYREGELVGTVQMCIGPDEGMGMAWDLRKGNEQRRLLPHLLKRFSKHLGGLIESPPHPARWVLLLFPFYRLVHGGPEMLGLPLGTQLGSGGGRV